MDSITLRAATVLCITILGSGCQGSGDNSLDSAASPSRLFEFALLGDNPYPPEDVPKFEALISEVNQEPKIEWVIHLGDIRGSSMAPCSDETLRARFDLYQEFQAPFVYTPGDNDWFDCGREAAGSYDEYERLDFLRRLFFPRPGFTTGRRAMEIQSQSEVVGYEEFVENSIWVKNDVVFSTVHLVAMTRPPTDPERALRRMDAALDWISKTFRLAAEINSPGVFIATQADPWIVSGHPPLIQRRCPDCLQPREGLERLYAVLEEESVVFKGSVVLAVGDTHVFRVDKPLYSSETGFLIENFTRVEPFGSPYAHWVRVRVDPSDNEVFAFEQEIVEANTAKKLVR
jgi:hypothetical protein